MGYVYRSMDITTGTYPTGSTGAGTLGTSKTLANRWRQPGDEAITNVPGLRKVNFNSIDWFTYADMNVHDASNIRFQQLTLGYTLPPSVMNKLKAFKSVTANATVSNLGIIWRANKVGVDPDYVSTTYYTNLPPSVNYALNLNFSF